MHPGLFVNKQFYSMRSTSTYQSCNTSVTLVTVSGVMSLPIAKSTSSCQLNQNQGRCQHQNLVLWFLMTLN